MKDPNLQMLSERKASKLDLTSSKKEKKVILSI